ncbi:MAG: DUF692 domain-containing protein [Gammaproteobacteria bacterium]|nr:DUF692 domain-containing protein [Gammaproteobacteria bacterium]
MPRNKYDKCDPAPLGLPDLGLGVGLRTQHFRHITTKWPAMDWFEILSENFIDTGGRPMYFLDQVAERYPIVMHGVSLSVGSTDPIDFGFLDKLKALAKRVRAKWLGDHVCWTGVAGLNGHDLYPLPYTEESLRHMVSRVRTIQDYLERPLVLENPSTYLTFGVSSMPEEEFIARLAEEADCALLLDVNNVYVTCRNHDLDPVAYLAAIPADRVVQIHLAGHTDNGTHCIDTHDGRVVDAVWELYARFTARVGARATLLEWDADIPKFSVLQQEVRKAARFRNGLRKAAA